MKITNTVAVRLFLLIVSVQTLVLAALTFATVGVQQSHLMDNVILSASSISDLIGRSTRYSMLLNRKEDVYNIITSLGGEPGIEGIRIYNKSGVVVFSTLPAEINSTADMNAEACVSCHGAGGLGKPHPSTEQLSRIFTKPGGDRVLGLITPIRNEAACSNTDCHAHPPSKTILGVLDVKMTLAQVDKRLEESQNQLLILSIAAVLLVSLISGGFIWMVVRRPVKRLIGGMAMVSSGELGHRLEGTSKDELGQLASAFNVMTEELAKAREENRAWSDTLEQKVKEKTADLERAHKQMVSVEKMASLGSLAATVAHELNNPLEGILTFARLITKKLKKTSLPGEQVNLIVDELKLVADETQRCGNIVKILLVFARQEGGALQEINLKTVFERCTLLMNHYAQMHSVKLSTSCPDGIILKCDPDQIQQALMALMVNGIEAMSATRERPEGGTLTVSASAPQQPRTVVITVADTGIGMSEEIKVHIFEPFFTTKSEGKGVGLGLAVVFGIIERHHGWIDVESSVGQGATFTITLPATQPRDPDNELLQRSREGVHT